MKRFSEETRKTLEAKKEELSNLMSELTVKSDYQELHEDAVKTYNELLYWCHRAQMAEGLLNKKQEEAHREALNARFPRGWLTNVSGL